MPRQAKSAEQTPDADLLAIERFITALRAERGISVNTADAYRRDLISTAADLPRTLPKGRRLLTAVADDIRHCLQQWSSNLAARSVARRLTTIHRFMIFCVEEGMRGDNPTTAIARPKLPKSLPKSLSEAEVGALFAAAEGMDEQASCRLLAMLEILYVTGMRVSELVSLPVSVVNRRQPNIIIRGKGGRERIVLMTAAAHDSVKRWLEWRDRNPKAVTSDYLFPSGEKHISREKAYTDIRALGKLAGIKEIVSPHMLRHSFATHMLNRGADLRSLQLLLGHASITTTEIYTKTKDERMAGLVRDTHPLARNPLARDD